MATRMLQRRGTAAEWAALNPVLSNGEIGFETDTKIIRVGDGVTAWNDLTLPYVMSGGGIMTGPLSLVEPTQNAHAVRKLDLDSAVQDIEDYVEGRRVRSAYSDPQTTITSAQGAQEVGDPVTGVEVGTSGRVLLTLSFHFEFNGGSSSNAVFGSAGYSGPDSGTTLTFVWGRNSPVDFRKSVQAQYIIEGRTPGTYSFQPRMSVSSNEAEFRHVTITATPLP